MSKYDKLKNFLCQIPEWDGTHDWRAVEAYDAEMAAEEYVQESEHLSAEYNVASGKCGILVRVKERMADKTWQEFIVTGELRPTYCARERTPVSKDSL